MRKLQTSDLPRIKAAIEALLFVNEKPLEVKELAGAIGVDKKDLVTGIEELIQEYQARDSGVCIVQVAGGYQMCSSPGNEEWIKKLYQHRSKHKLSTAALETLAIISYKQPITRIEIESIRGVNVDGVSKHLFNLGLIKTAGRKDVVGRPFLYVTTRKFLEYFGLNSLKDLPSLEEFAALAQTDGVIQEVTNTATVKDCYHETEQPKKGTPVSCVETEPIAVPNECSDTVRKEEE